MLADQLTEGITITRLRQFEQFWIASYIYPVKFHEAHSSASGVPLLVKKICRLYGAKCEVVPVPHRTRQRQILRQSGQSLGRFGSEALSRVSSKGCEVVLTSPRGRDTVNAGPIGTILGSS